MSFVRTVAYSLRRKEAANEAEVSGNSRQRQKGFLEFLRDSSISIRAPSRDSLTFPGGSSVPRSSV